MKKATKQKIRRGILYAVLIVIVALVALLADWGLIQSSFFNLEIAVDMFPVWIDPCPRSRIDETV